MKALTGFVACAVVTAFAVGCDNHDRLDSPLVDTTTVTGADLAARDAGVQAAAGLAIPPLPVAATDLPVVRATPANGAYVAPQMQVSPPAMPAGQVAAPVATAPTSVASGATTDTTGAPSATGTGGAANFVGSSFGPAPSTPDYVVPPSPPSDNQGNGTLGSSTGSHEFDNGANP